MACLEWECNQKSHIMPILLTLGSPSSAPELRAINAALPSLRSTSDCVSALFPTETSPKCTELPPHMTLPGPIPQPGPCSEEVTVPRDTQPSPNCWMARSALQGSSRVMCTRRFWFFTRLSAWREIPELEASEIIATSYGRAE